MFFLIILFVEPKKTWKRLRKGKGKNSKKDETGRAFLSFYVLSRFLLYFILEEEKKESVEEEQPKCKAKKLSKNTFKYVFV